MWIVTISYALVGWALTVEIILAVLEDLGYIVKKSGTVESVNIDVGDVVFRRVVIFPFLHQSNVARSCLEREDSCSLGGESRHHVLW